MVDHSSRHNGLYKPTWNWKETPCNMVDSPLIHHLFWDRSSIIHAVKRKGQASNPIVVVFAYLISNDLSAYIGCKCVLLQNNDHPPMEKFRHHFPCGGYHKYPMIQSQPGYSWTDPRHWWLNLARSTFSFVKHRSSVKSFEISIKLAYSSSFLGKAGNH